jgi:serine/threonine-protein kinase
MELVRGRSLDRILDHRQRLPEEEALRIVRAVLHALEHAHARGVLHRDVKPDNVLVGLDGGVKLSDFGLARLIASDRRLTRSGIALGTPDYIAPEQIECRPDADGRADLYSLGAMLYRMLTGAALYPAADDQKMMLRHLYDPLPDPRALVPGLSTHTVTVLHRLLAKKPEDRYPGAAAAGADIDDLLSGRRPGLAGGPATPVQLFLSQHGATLLGGGLLALGAILLFAVAKILTRG